MQKGLETKWSPFSCGKLLLILLFLFICLLTSLTRFSFPVYPLQIGRPSDVWSLGCILYMMVYGRTPFQHITNHVIKLQCIMDSSHVIEFPDIKDKHLLDVMKVTFANCSSLLT